MTDLIEKIKNRSSNIKEQRNVFVSKLIELNDMLAESLDGIDIHANSAHKTLDMIGPDDWIYGYLSFSNGELKVSYRSTEDDFHDAIDQVPPEFKSYESSSLKSCSINWLEKLSSERQINQLLSNIEKSLVSIEDSTTVSLESLNTALDSQSEEIAKETTDVLKEYASEDLLRIWLKARSIIQSDPSDSITRSSSYLESVCRLILKELNEPLPKTITITSLIGASVKVLDLSDNTETNTDLKQLFGGIKSIFQAVGAMRTHLGSAHGFSPGDYVAQEHYARLINDAAATVSTYLLRRLKLKQNQSTQKDNLVITNK